MDQDIFLASFTHYLTAVDTSGQPLQEAAFLQQASNIEAVIGSSSSDFGNQIESNGTPYGIGITYITPEQPVILSASYLRVSEDFDSPYHGDYTVKILTLGVGYYLSDSFAAGITHTTQDTDVDFYGSDNSTAHETTLQAKYVASLSYGQYLNIEPSLSHVTGYGDATDTLGIAGDFYINRNTSIGAELSTIISDQDGTAAGIRARTFITDTASVAVAYTDNRIDDGDIKDTLLEISAALRF